MGKSGRKLVRGEKSKVEMRINEESWFRMAEAYGGVDKGLQQNDVEM